MKKIGVVLCGSGFKDGSEIREAVATLWALSQKGAHVQCYAPNAIQADVINCLTGDPLKETRNMLVEAARIARGEVKSLNELKVSALDALILPGGYGAAKNLCTFALQGSKGTVRADMQSILDEALGKKPLGAICIAPAILALAFKGKGLSLTVGEQGEAAQEIEKLGHKHVVTKATDIHTDTAHKVVTTPAYMYGDAPLHEVFTGIQKLVGKVLELC